MINFKKKVISVFMILSVFVVSVAFTPTEVVSAYEEDVVISNITSSSFDANWNGVINNYLDPNTQTITGVDVTLYKYVDGNSTVALKNSFDSTNYITYGNFYNLSSDTLYQVEVIVYVFDSNLNDTLSYTGMSIGVYTLNSTSSNTNTSRNTNNNTTNNNTTNTTTNNSTNITVPTPSVAAVKMRDTYVNVSANGSAKGFEYRICNSKNKVINSYDTALTSWIFSGIKSNSVYYAQVRAYNYDSNYNKVYSNWSAKKYFIAQPTINPKKSKYSKDGKSLTFKWGKVKGAKSYTVYARKSGKKWSKIGTTKKTSLKFTKLKKQRINLFKQRYELTVVANGKAGGKKIKSDNSRYLYTYTLYYTK
ncbi:MAG: hypothetical protein K6G88_15100 [Lachnospiraceae bacterium]|nr:hypothetical protein [Lachnospiraceae bacterium]